MSLIVERYWVPSGGGIPLFEDGFMPDPGGDWSSKYVPEALSLSDIEERGLVLIGEPGLGKTTALRAEYRRVLEWSQTQDDGAELVHWVGLGETRDPGRLREMIFGAAPFNRWAQSDHGRLHLFLDSLDEARMKIERTADLLLGGLEEIDFSRLVLRLTCRSADRHQGLEQTLEQRFGKDQFSVRELAPLCRRDAQRLADSRAIDGDSIVRQIIDRELQPLAMVPESLGFLLDVAAESGFLPSDRAKLIEQGLRFLVREPDEERRHNPDSGGSLSTGARLSLASRVGAALLLSGRRAVGADERDPGPDQATRASLCGGTEIDASTAVQRQIDVNEGALNEVLGTALFSSDGSEGLGLGQASYAEYLCARWLAA